MNFIDRMRIRINPNIIDSFSSEKLKADIITYAINCGYKFNPDTIGKFVSNSNYQQAFKNEEEVYQYLKQSIFTQDDKESKENFYNTYSRYGMNKDEYIRIVKEDEELSENYVEKLQEWKEVFHYIDIKNVIEIIDGKDELTDRLLQNCFDTLRDCGSFRKFAEYIATVKTPQELYDMNIKDTTMDQAFITTANPQNYLELFEKFDENKFFQYQYEFISSIKNNVEQFIPYLDKLDEVYQTKMSRSFVTDEIKNKVMECLKENNVLYNENVPKFALEDNEYVLQCIRAISNNITIYWKIG